MGISLIPNIKARDIPYGSDSCNTIQDAYNYIKSNRGVIALDASCQLRNQFQGKLVQS